MEDLSESNQNKTYPILYSNKGLLVIILCILISGTYSIAQTKQDTDFQKVVTQNQVKAQNKLGLQNKDDLQKPGASSNQVSSQPVYTKQTNSQVLVRGLDFYVQQSFQNSPLLKEYLNLQLSASLDSLRVRRSNGPQISANALGQYAPAFNHFGYDNAISNGGTYSATVNVSQAILNKTFIKSQLQNVLVKTDSLGNSRKISLADLKKNLINQYILAYTDQKQFYFQQELLKLLVDQESVMKPLVRAGVYKQSDYLTFLVSRQSQEVTVAQQKIAVQNDFAALNLICGLSDTLFYRLNEPEITRQQKRDVGQNPLFIKYSLDSLRILSLKQSLDSYYKPKLNWFADAGFESSNLAFYKNYGASFGLNFSIPIYDGHIRQIGYKQLKITERTRQNYKSFFAKQFDQQVIALEQQLASTETLVKIIERQLHYSSMLIDVDRKLLNAGDLKITDYLLALNAYRTTQFTLNQQNLSRLLLLNQLNYWNSEY